MNISISHWGEFEAPVRIVKSEFGLDGKRVKYSSPVERWDGKAWVKVDK